MLMPATAHAAPASIQIDYPAQGSLFPPDITAPTFLWRDHSDEAKVWRIEVAFADGAHPLVLAARGELMKVGELDSSYEGFVPPALTPEQAVTHTWKPDERAWALIRAHSVQQPATVTIRGLSEAASAQPVSVGEVSIRTSKDPVGAPIFYRDVPLIPWRRTAKRASSGHCPSRPCR